MEVNITKEKKLTNMRSAAADNFENLTPPRQMTLEECLEFAREDECVEVTPEAIRIRKVILSPTSACARRASATVPDQHHDTPAPGRPRRRRHTRCPAR